MKHHLMEITPSMMRESLTAAVVADALDFLEGEGVLSRRMVQIVKFGLSLSNSCVLFSRHVGEIAH